MQHLANKDLNLLVSLRALLEEANVTRAGDRLEVGQSAMSIALSRLRSEYNDELLVRVGREYELTPLARHLLPHVQRAIPLIEGVLGDVDAFDPANSARTFTFVTPDFTALEIWADLERIIADAPHVSIEMIAPATQQQTSEHDLLQHDFLSTVPSGGVEGECAVLFRDRFVCLVDKANPALDNCTLSWDAFRALPQLVVEFDQDYRTPADMKLTELGFQREPSIRLKSYLPVPAIVAGTDLVAVVPSRLVDRLGTSTGTVGVEPPFGPVDIVETIWWHPSRRTDPAHTWFRNALLSSIPQNASL
ncbi:LysR family transcriptional regulator [Okibacterium endophyticum]